MFSLLRNSWVILLLLAIDWYAFQAVRTLVHEWHGRARLVVYLAYGLFSLGSYAFLFFRAPGISHRISG